MSAALSTWDASPTQPVDGYNVYLRKEEEGQVYQKVNATRITDLQKKLTNLSPGTYSAYETAVKGLNESDPSNIVTFTIEFDNKYKPTGLQATVVDAGNGDVNFSWNYVSGITQFNMYLEVGGSYTKQNSSPLNAPQISLSGLSGGSYNWYVVPLYDGVEGTQSDVASFSFEALSIDSFAASPLDGGAELSWSITEGSGTLTAVEYELDDSGTWNALTTSLSHTEQISGLTNGQQYSIKLRATTDEDQVESSAVLVTPEAASGFQSTYSLLFDGSQYVDLGAQNLSQYLTLFTFECWIKFTSTALEDIFGTFQSGSNSSFELSANVDEGFNSDAGNVRIFIKDEDGNTLIASFTNNPGLNDGVWHHLAIARTGSNTFKFYIDGVDSSVSYSNTTNPDNFADFGFNLYMAALNNAGTAQRQLNGNIFEFRFWNDVRTTQEIQDNKDISLVPATDFPTDYPNLKMYYRMTDESGDTLTDAIGSYNGTLNGNVSDNMWDEDIPNP